MRSILTRLDQKATGRRVAISASLVISLLVIANVVGAIFYSHNNGHGLLDYGGAANALTTKEPLTASRALAEVAAWGPGGRHGQLLFTVFVDILLPVSGLAFGVLALLHATRRLGAPAWLRYSLPILPISYFLSDCGENLGIIILVLGYPSHLAGVAEATAWLSASKNNTLNLTLAAIFVAYVVLLLRYPTKRLLSRHG